MSKKTKIILITTLLIVLFALIFFICIKSNINRNADKAIEDIESNVAKEEDKFIVYDKDGNEVIIDDFLGEPICMVIFNSVAQNARLVLDYIEEYYDLYKSDIEFLIINTNDPDPNIIDTMENTGYPFNFYYDLDGIAENFYTYDTLPYIAFIKKDGTINQEFESIIVEDVLDANLELISGEYDLDV